MTKLGIFLYIFAAFKFTLSILAIMSQPIKVFVSYSHKDESFKEELDIRLTLIHRKIPLEIWTDKKIKPGQLWDDKIKNALDNADVVLLLVSDYFLASNYITNIEIKKALEGFDAGKTTVIPIVLRPVDFGDYPEINKFQALPSKADPISTWDNMDKAWLSVSKGLKDTFESIKPKTPDNSDNNNTDDNSDSSVGSNSDNKDNDSAQNNSNSPSTTYKSTGDGINLQGVHSKRDTHIHIYQHSQPPTQDSPEPSAPTEKPPNTTQNPPDSSTDAKTVDMEVFEEARKKIIDTNVKDAIELLMNYTKTKDKDKYNTLIVISSRFNRMEKQTLYRRQEDIDISTSQIELALTSIIDDLEKEAGK